MIILALVFLVVLLAFTTTFTVRFTERAVLTTFGRAGDGAVKVEPGLYFKAPYPVQSVTKYETQARVLTIKLETQQTADNRQITLEGFCIWRVDDPLKFFQRFSNAGSLAQDHYAAAEGVLRSNLRAAQGLVSGYRMGELFTVQVGGSKLPELEGRILDRFTKSADQSGLSLADYGIRAERVGISRVVLPAAVTSAVFDAMKQVRLSLAQETQSRGEAQATAIRSRAEADAKRIRAFAERRALEIRSEGDRESARFLAEMNQAPDLAVFLTQVEFLKTFEPKALTLVFPSSMPGFNLFSPSALEGLQPGKLPGSPASRNVGESIQRVTGAESAPKERP